MKNSYEEMLKDCNQQLSFVKVEFERDLDTLHKWMHEDHVIPYWNLNFTKEKFAVHLKKALADTHQTLYLGCLDSNSHELLGIVLGKRRYHRRLL